MRHLTRRKATVTASVLGALALVFSLSACSGLPHLARTDAIAKADACTTTLLKAQDLQKGAEGSSGAVLTLAARVVAAVEASNTWLQVSRTCSTRFSEGIIKAGAAHQLAKNLSARAGFSSSAEVALGISGDSSTATNFGNFGTTTVPASTDKAILRDMAVSQDKAAFALEVLAARTHPTDATDEALSLEHRAIATNLAEDARACTPDEVKNDGCSTTDPRKKVYSVASLLNDSGTVTDAATGLVVPSRAALEMNCALEEIEAASDATGTSAKYALAQFIVRDVAAAYALDYPLTPLPLTEQATS
ncbi:MAG: hypothetical protein LKI93_05970 [Bifidobacteriaceae bacterium]|jgi:hypothetical protein|nr:hypothetical protein [Bifidobacteriaceae bacterium]